MRGSPGKRRKSRQRRYYLLDWDTQVLKPDSPRRRWFCRFDILEQLVEDPHKRVVILTPEHFRDECSSLDQEFRRKLQTLQHQLVLSESILNPSGTDIRRTIVQHDIGFPVVHVLLELGSAVRCRNIGDKGCDMGQGSDGIQIDTDNQRSLWHVLFGDLKPTSRRSTQIDCTFRLGEKVIFPVEVD